MSEVSTQKKSCVPFHVVYLPFFFFFASCFALASYHIYRLKVKTLFEINKSLSYLIKDRS